MPFAQTNADVIRNLQYVELICATAALILLYFAIRAHIIGVKLQRFTDDLTTMLEQFLARNATWSTVVNNVLQTAPDTLEGLLRLALSTQELVHQINRAGGIARLFSDANRKPTSPPKQEPEDSQPKQRKPRVIRTKPDPKPSEQITIEESV